MIYNEKNCFLYKGMIYERLFNHPEGHKYRVVITKDDYDYVTDKRVIPALDRAFANRKVV